MSDLISRSYVYKAIGAEPNGACGICKNDRSECMCHSFSKMDICSILDDAPDVDAEPIRHGHWVNDEGKPVPFDRRYIKCPESSCYCSKCGEWLTASDEYAVVGLYCPHCGARMDEEEREDG